MEEEQDRRTRRYGRRGWPKTTPPTRLQTASTVSHPTSYFVFDDTVPAASPRQGNSPTGDIFTAQSQSPPSVAPSAWFTYKEPKAPPREDLSFAPDTPVRGKGRPTHATSFWASGDGEEAYGAPIYAAQLANGSISIDEKDAAEGKCRRRKRKMICLAILILIIIIAVVCGAVISIKVKTSSDLLGQTVSGEESDSVSPTAQSTKAPTTQPTPLPTTSPTTPNPTTVPTLSPVEVATPSARPLSVNRSLDENGMPYWDWNWVQIWTQRGRKNSTVSEADLAFIETYPVSMYVVSKSVSQDVEPGYVHNLGKQEEDLALIKARVSDLPVFSYLNSALNFPMLDNVWCPLQNMTDSGVLPNYLYSASKPRYGCVDYGNGTYGRTNKISSSEENIPMYDLRMSEVADTLVYFANLTREAGFEGIFLDRADVNCANGRVCQPTKSAWVPTVFSTKAEAYAWDSAHDDTMRRIQNESFVNHVVVGNNRNVEGLSGRQHEKFGIEEYYLKPSSALASFMEGARSGKLIQAFANPCSLDEVVITPNAGTQLLSGRFMRVNTLAMFLIGMCKYSYYSCALGFIADNSWNERQENNADLNLTDDELWAGNYFFDEYMYNLGEPQGLALEEHLSDGQSLYYREFKSSLNNNYTKVWLHIVQEKIRTSSTGEYDIRSVISWADGNISTSDASVNLTSIQASFDELYSDYLEQSFVQNETCNTGIYT